MSASVLVAAALGVEGCTVHYDEVSASGRVEYWHPSVHGNVSITRASQPGTASDVSLRRDAGLDDGGALGAGLDLDLGPYRVAVEYQDLAMHGSTVAPEDFIFHGQRFPQGNLVSADLKCPTTRASWSYAFWQRGESSWWAGLGARFWTFDLEMTDDTTGVTTSRRFNHVFPMAVTDGSFDLGHGLSTLLRADIAAISRSQVIFDAAAGLAYQMVRFRAELGWRFMRYDINEAANEGDFDLSGPFLALRFTF